MERCYTYGYEKSRNLIRPAGNLLMLYLNNKYTNWYNEIIESARHSSLTGYCERHHIIPRGLGGSNDPVNIVALSAKAHFVCHLLLTKMTIGQDRIKMKYAASLLAGKNNSKGFIVTGRIYESIRTGWKQSPEHIKKKADARRGCKNTPESLKRMSLAAKKRGTIYKICHCGIIIDARNYAKYHGGNCGKKGLWPISEEQKKKIGKANKGRILPKIECSHCHKFADGGNYARWHGDNCKAKYD